MTTHDKFKETTRVQMSAWGHLHRLEYNYFGKVSEDMANTVITRQRIFWWINVFKKQFAAFSQNYSSDAEQVLKTIRQELGNDDLDHITSV